MLKPGLQQARLEGVLQVGAAIVRPARSKPKRTVTRAERDHIEKV